MIARTLMAAAAGLLLAGAAQAQPKQYLVTVSPTVHDKGFEKLTVSKAALAGTQIRLWANTSIDPDCTEHPGATLSVLQPPGHGTVNIDTEPFYAAFPAANPRSVCNAKKVPGRQAFYTANAGFSGHDKVVLQGSSPDGRVRQITVDILVR